MILKPDRAVSRSKCRREQLSKTNGDWFHEYGQLIRIMLPYGYRST